MTEAELTEKMSYCYGTENYYRDNMNFFLYTDGVRTFCDEAQAWWFLDIIRSLYFEHKYRKHLENDFVAIKLIVAENNTAEVVFLGDDGKKFYEQNIMFTDCPKGEWVFYLTDKVLMWNGEY